MDSRYDVKVRELKQYLEECLSSLVQISWWVGQIANDIIKTIQEIFGDNYMNNNKTNELKQYLEEILSDLIESSWSVEQVIEDIIKNFKRNRVSVINSPVSKRSET